MKKDALLKQKRDCSFFFFFVGLTLGLMGLDRTNLHVMVESGTEDERKNARRVLRLLDRGKHWVLVTLLLSNVIVNETLPIILDSLFGGGWQAILISTALIVIFGEYVYIHRYYFYWEIKWLTVIIIIGSFLNVGWRNGGRRNALQLIHCILVAVCVRHGLAIGAQCSL